MANAFLNLLRANARKSLAAVLCLALCACSSLKPWQNQVLLAGEAAGYDGHEQLFDTARIPDVLVVGELDSLPYAWQGRSTTLAREIDMVIGVSGGSVAAAQPLLFSPLSVQVHRDGCSPAQDAVRANAATAGDSARVKLTKGELGALATGERRFIHLVDGGLSDNLGTRRITDYVAQIGGIGAVLQSLGQGSDQSGPLPLHIVFIAINSERQGPLPIDQRGQVPSMLEVADALIFQNAG